MQQLDGVIQSNSASSEELASTAEELAAQSTQLRENIAFFKLDQRRDRSASPAARRAAAPARPVAKKPRLGQAPARSATHAVAKRGTTSQEGVSIDLGSQTGGPDARDDEFEAA
jgi:hypothetical protein